MEVNTPTSGSDTFKDNIKDNIKDSIKDTPLVPMAITDAQGIEADACRVIDCINTLSGKKFKYSVTSLTPIKARLKEGYTYQQCIDVCISKWDDPDLKLKYFWPVTLFRASLFESYVNEIGTVYKHTQPTRQEAKYDKWKKRFTQR